MKVGINNISLKANELVASAVLAEELGYESVWMGEHVLLPHGTKYPAAPQPYGPQELLDVFVLLSHLVCLLGCCICDTPWGALGIQPPCIRSKTNAANR